ncbi:AraC-type DNA-binding protein [Flavobacteriaceae bacterium MAR_2010_188]|nr:AraC-type DNA-binding protein [Flavobacteriaceae bacterium MAR_2010_188]
MYFIKERNIIEVLAQLAQKLDANFSRDFSCASLILDNHIGRGAITAYELFPGLAALIYSVKFNEDITISVDESSMNPLYFIFCINGKLKHRFSDEIDTRSIHIQQNVILTSSKQQHNVFKFPKDEKIEASFIYLLRETDELDDSKIKYLRTGVQDILEEIGEIDSYKFFGHIRPKTATYVERIIHNNKKGVVGRLLVEASIMSILALQIENHEEEITSPKLNPPIKQDELMRILKLSETITSSLDKTLSVKDLSKLSSLNPKKLQAGYRYLFGMSANAYIKNVRLETALELLQTTDLSISEIVYRIGLSSRSYFTRLFTERYGYKPSEYKNMIKSIHIDLLE